MCLLGRRCTTCGARVKNHVGKTEKWCINVPTPNADSDLDLPAPEPDSPRRSARKSKRSGAGGKGAKPRGRAQTDPQQDGVGADDGGVHGSDHEGCDTTPGGPGSLEAAAEPVVYPCHRRASGDAVQDVPGSPDIRPEGGQAMLHGRYTLTQNSVCVNQYPTNRNYLTSMQTPREGISGVSHCVDGTNVNVNTKLCNRLNVPMPVLHNQPSQVGMVAHTVYKQDREMDTLLSSVVLPPAVCSTTLPHLVLGSMSLPSSTQRLVEQLA